MSKTYYRIAMLLEIGFFNCVEDAIDCIQTFYKAGDITLDERNKLLKAI